MNFNKIIDIYKSVPKEKLTAEYFKRADDDIDLQRLLKAGISAAQPEYNNKSTLVINANLGTFIYESPRRVTGELTPKISNEKQAIAIASSMLKKIDTQMLKEYGNMQRPHNPFKTIVPPLIAPLFENVRHIFTVNRGNFWECVFKRQVSYTESYTNKIIKVDIFNSEIRIFVERENDFYYLEYNAPILYRDTTPALRMDLSKSKGITLVENLNTVIYIHDYKYSITTPFYKVLSRVENQEIPMLTYESLSNIGSFFLKTPIFHQVTTIKNQIRKMDMGGVVYVELLEEAGITYGQYKSKISQIMDGAKAIFAKQGVSISFTYKKNSFNSGVPRTLLSHNVLIIATINQSGLTGHFNESRVDLNIQGNDFNLNFAARTLAHEVLHGYASKLGYLLFGTARFFGPDNKVADEIDLGHLVYKEQKDVGDLNRIYPNLLLGQAGVAALGPGEKPDFITKIDERMLPFIKNRATYFSIDDMNPILKQELGDDAVKWEVYKRRLDMIIAGRSGDYKEVITSTLRTANLSKFNFNTQYEPQ